jgi:phospholipid transport system substrate-binding protein
MTGPWSVFLQTLQANRHILMRLRVFHHSTKWFGLAVLLVLVWCGPLPADNGREVQDLLKKRLDAVLLVLQNEDISIDAKKEKVSDIVTPMFNFQLMAKLTLGKAQWSAMSAQQQEKFTALFIELLRGTYLDRISLYTDEKIIINDSVAISDSKVKVNTVLVSKGENLTMLYKFYRADGVWGVYDVEIEGVSLIRSYLNQFREFLSKGTIDDLIQELEKPEKT